LGRERGQAGSALTKFHFPGKLRQPFVNIGPYMKEAPDLRAIAGLAAGNAKIESVSFNTSWLVAPYFSIN
jgi:hypothetical protein